MKYSSIGISVEEPSDYAGALAASVFCDEINRRFVFEGAGECCNIIFSVDSGLSADEYRVSALRSGFRFESAGIRGYIFAVGLFLRKTVPVMGGFETVCDITGLYRPDKQIRGHQLGYRPLNNTYDMWSLADFNRYYLDLMYFGANTVEHIPYAKGQSSKTDFMQYDELELLYATSGEAKKLGLMVSLWCPNCEKDLETAVANRKEVFFKTPQLDFVFPPGADPGDLPVPELFEWLKAISGELTATHPAAKMTPSAQMPHNCEGWGEQFIAEMNKNPGFIDYVVQGPNRAFTTEELRKRLPKRYPVRLYPDITHNVRCETPVHFDRDDWHYAWATALSRECINPRPSEYRDYHFLHSQYTIGSVTYSEGVNDDINKAVWCALEWDPRLPVREILCDYSRLYLPGADPESIADGILGLENNWLTCPQHATGAEAVYNIFRKAAEDAPSLKENWRWQSCMFRAACDLFIRLKTLAGDKVCKEAENLIRRGKNEKAKAVLDSFVLPARAAALREEAEELAGLLYKSVGIQLSVEKYNADGVERGAVLDTIDLPVTDVEYLANILGKAEKTGNAGLPLTAVTLTDKPENGFSWFLSLDGLISAGQTQTPDFYMDFAGDRPERNDGTLPMCCVKLFDHYRFALSAGGLDGTGDYTLTVIMRDSPDENAVHHKIEINGRTVYDGPQFGGEKNGEISAVLPSFLTAVDYTVPNGYLENGTADLVISEPVSGCEISAVIFKERK